jgi:hypothetical protein
MSGPICNFTIAPDVERRKATRLPGLLYLTLKG